MFPTCTGWAAKGHGVFVNPALTEPFGLTLLEAGATGLPIVATNDGGPRDIIANCDNGLLIDPLDGDADRKGVAASLDRTGSMAAMVRGRHPWDAQALFMEQSRRPLPA